MYINNRKLLILGPASNEFGYNNHPATVSRFLYIKITDYSVKKFGYNEHPLLISSFFCIVLLASGTQCKICPNPESDVTHKVATNFENIIWQVNFEGRGRVSFTTECR